MPTQMASWPSSLRTEAEFSTTTSKSTTPPTTTTSNPFFLRDEDFDHGLDKEEISKSTAKVLEAMGSQPVLPDYLNLTPSGPIDSGFYPTEYYGYGDELLSCTWEEGLEAIEDFDWGQRTSEGQQKQDETDREAQFSTLAAEKSQSGILLLDGASQSVLHNSPSAFDSTETEPPDSEDFLGAKPNAAPSHFMSSLLSLPREEPTVPILPSSAPSRSIERDFIENPPSKATTPPEKITATLSLGLAHPVESIEHPSMPNILPDNTVQVIPNMTHNITDGRRKGAESMRNRAEAGEKLSVQSAAQEVNPTSHVPDKALTPSDGTADQADTSGRNEEHTLVYNESNEEAQEQTNSDAAEANDSSDWDSLFEDGGEEPAQDLQQYGQKIEVERSCSGTTEPMETPAQASAARTQMPDNGSIGSVTKDTPIETSPESDLEDSESLSPKLLEEHVTEVRASTEALARLSLSAESKIERGKIVSEGVITADSSCRSAAKELSPIASPQKEPLSGTPNAPAHWVHQMVAEQDPSTRALATKDGYTAEESGKSVVHVDNSSCSALQGPSIVPSLQNESLIDDLPVEKRWLQQNDSEQVSAIGEGLLRKDVHSVNESHTVPGPTKPTVSGEEAGFTSLPDRGLQYRPFKLKIDSRFWNPASLVLRDHDDGDTKAVEDAPMAPISISGNAMAELQRPEDVVSLSRMEPSEGDTHRSNPALLERSPNEPVSLGDELPSVEGASLYSEESTSEPLLPGVEEAAAAAPSSTIIPSRPIGMGHLEDHQAASWPGFLLEQQLELPPSPYEAEPRTDAPSVETCEMESNVPLSGKATLIVGSQAKSKDIPFPVLKQDTPQESYIFSSDLTQDETSETLPSPVSPTSNSKEPLDEYSQLNTAKVVPKKRIRPTKETNVASNASMEYKLDEGSGSEDEAPMKKKQKRTAIARGSAKSSSFQTSTIASRSKSNTGVTAPRGGHRRRKATLQVIQRELAAREVTEVESQEDIEDDDDSASSKNSVSTTENSASDRPRHPFETTFGKRVTRGDLKNGKEVLALANTRPVQGATQTRNNEEETPVDSEPETATVNPKPASKAKGKGNTKATPAKAPRTPKTPPTTKAPPRGTRAKAPPAKTTAPKGPVAAPRIEAEAATKRSKFGFKPPTGRKRKSTEAKDAAEPPQPPPAQTKPKRQTRQASAAQELERQKEIETNVAKRTRGARKSLQ